MADILKISTPMVDRNNTIHQNRQPEEAGTQFQMLETKRVVQTNPQSELLQQNNGMPTREESPAILMDLLRDPSVSVNFLKNIYLLQEIINLIPVNNEAMTNEINQMFKELMVKPEQIAGELMKQEGDATIFKGELFDMLRNLVAEGGGRSDLRYAVANLLKSMNAALSKDDILWSVSNNLKFLSENLQSAKPLYARLTELAEKFQEPFAARNFPELKNQTLLLMREVENSILFNPKLEKLLPLVTYNLSRFNDNEDYLQDAANSLLNLLGGGDQKAEFLAKLKSFLQRAPLRRAMGSEYAVERPGSKVMEALAKLIGKEASSEELSGATAEKLEKIIHSLLSSPCNFTPLLHFIVPVEDDGTHSFAEIWIDTSKDEAPRQGREPDEENMHLLIVFDVEGIGQFEAELFVNGKKLGLNLLCPPAYIQQFMELRDHASRIAAGTSYSLGEIFIGGLERPRSLMDVFKTLPHRRAGIDVKV